jgi:hypothetical protein
VKSESTAGEGVVFPEFKGKGKGDSGMKREWKINYTKT